MTEHEMVKDALAEIFRKNGYTSLIALTQRDFDHISEKIEAGTGILISGSTLRRLLNGKFSRLPQVATLNAISKYLGCQHWQAYRTLVLQSKGYAEFPQADEGTETITDSTGTSWSPKVIAVAGLATFVLIIVGFIELSKTNQLLNAGKATFDVSKNTRNDIPNTVVFSYNIDDVNADSFFIQQSWDKNRRVRVFKNKYTLTDIYYEPGYHLAKLIANDSVIKVAEVNIPTDRWLFFAKDVQPGSNPQYIKPTHTMTNGIFGIRKKDLVDNGIDIASEKEYIYNFSPEKLATSSDNFSFKAKFRMTAVKDNACPYITVDVFCQRYTMFTKFTTKGCASESVFQFGEHLISGKDTDLAALSFDVTEWMEVRLIVQDKEVTVLLNGKEVFKTAYGESSRLITGLAFISNGLCEIDFTELKGSDGTIVYANNFDNESIDKP